MKYLGLGSNLGNREENLQKALKLISTKFELIDISSTYYTKPWGKLDQQPFVNIAAQIESNLPPQETLDILLSIEKQMGRIRKEKWGERIIDIDIILWDNEVIITDDLSVPHVYLCERDFVLEPIIELDNHILHPVTIIPLSQYLQNLDIADRTIVDVCSKLDILNF